MVRPDRNEHAGGAAAGGRRAAEWNFHPAGLSAGGVAASPASEMRKIFRKAEPPEVLPRCLRWDGLRDPPSSFVPDFEPRLGGVFLGARAPLRERSRRVSGIDRGRGLQSAVLRHGRGVGRILLTTRAETRPRDIVLG